MCVSTLTDVICKFLLMIFTHDMILLIYCTGYYFDVCQYSLHARESRVSNMRFNIFSDYTRTTQDCHLG